MLGAEAARLPFEQLGVGINRTPIQQTVTKLAIHARLQLDDERIVGFASKAEDLLIHVDAAVVQVVTEELGADVQRVQD